MPNKGIEQNAGRHTDLRGYARLLMPNTLDGPMDGVPMVGDLDLPSGITAELLSSAVSASGYPLQTVVARELVSGFDIIEEWGFVDRTTGEHRALDLFAHAGLDSTSANLVPSLNLLIECKRSELPYVFFEAAVPRSTRGFPPITGFKTRRFELHKRGDGYSDCTPAELLDPGSLPFMQLPPIASTFCRAERKGKELQLSGSVPYTNVVMPLASALEFQFSRWANMREQEVYYPQISLCVCVIDAPLVVASGTPEEPELRDEPWVRLLREEAAQEGNYWTTRYYTVDVVRRQFLSEYVGDHALRFAQQLVDRMLEKESMMRAAKGVVDSPDWSWPDIEVAR